MISPLVVEVRSSAGLTYLRVEGMRLWRLAAKGWEELSGDAPGVGGRVLTNRERRDLESQWGTPTTQQPEAT